MKQYKRDALVSRWAPLVKSYTDAQGGYHRMFYDMMNEYEQIEKEEDASDWGVAIGGVIGILLAWAFILSDWGQGIIHAALRWI